jgi:hypothetical protein
MTTDPARKSDFWFWVGLASVAIAALAVSAVMMIFGSDIGDYLGF